MEASERQCNSCTYKGYDIRLVDTDNCIVCELTRQRIHLYDTACVQFVPIAGPRNRRPVLQQTLF